MPLQFPLAQTEELLQERGVHYQLWQIGADREQQYVSLLFYYLDEEAVMGCLKSRGFSRANFPGVSGTPLEEIALAEGRIKQYEQTIVDAQKDIATFTQHRALLEEGYDAYAQEAGQDAVLSQIGYTGKTAVLYGWVPQEAEQSVAEALDKHGCAYSFTEPQEDDDVPTATKNGPLSHPFGAVTEMYGMPAYNSIVDPNPLMMPFYVVFFGFIMADAAYGLLMMLGCGLVLKLAKPTGTMKQMMGLFFYCGISTFIAGALTGGWFADGVYVFTETFFGNGVSIPPIWFNPLEEPMTMLVFSLALGAVQILTGMAISAYRQIKRGHALDAFFDVGSWYMVFIGAGLYVGLGVGVGLYVALAGVALLLLTGGRDQKGLGKVTGGLGKIYGVTGYLSDLLSYSRIMALGLSGAVVGQVFNKMGAMGGGGIVGLLLFIVVFAIGHSFNIAISLLGAYVHTSRLQYIEFFGRFYEGGGRPFRPLVSKTKYVDIIKED